MIGNEIELQEQVRPVSFRGGAKRSSYAPAYDLIEREFLVLLTEALLEGHIKYDPDFYTRNWKSGDHTFAADAYNHVVNHLTLANASLQEDLSPAAPQDILTHLGHAGAGLMFLVFYASKSLWPLAAAENLLREQRETTQGAEAQEAPQDTHKDSSTTFWDALRHLGGR